MRGTNMLLAVTIRKARLLLVRLSIAAMLML